MSCIELLFHGYTWDEYSYLIANKSGILVTYKGKLDCEGFVKLTEILSVDEVDMMCSIFQSKKMEGIRNSIEDTDRLFFSYAEMGIDGRTEVVSKIRSFVLPCSANSKLPDVRLSCKGACALFPKELML